MGCAGPEAEAPESAGEALVAEVNPRQAGCVSVPENTLAYLTDVLAEDGITLRHAKAFMSGEAYRGQLFYYIAAEVDAPGYEGMDDIGVWTAFDLHGGVNSGPTMAVGPVARRASEFGTASRAPIVAGSYPGVAEAIRCVQDAIADASG